MPLGRDENMRQRRVPRRARGAVEAGRPVTDRPDCLGEFSITTVHLAEKHDVAPTKHFEHPANDLDLVALGVDLHDVGLDGGSSREEVVEGGRLDASEAISRTRVVGRQKSRCCRMPCVQESLTARVRDRRRYDVHVRERVELDVPAKPLGVFDVRLERDDRSRWADEPSGEKREEAHVRADVDEDRARLDEPFEGVLHR